MKFVRSFLALFLAVPAGFALPGTNLWTFTTTGPIEASPAIGADGTLFFGSYDQKFYAVTPGGSNKWMFPLPSPGFGVGFYSSPAIGPDGTVHTGADDGKVYAFHPVTGSNKWTFATSGGAVYSSPAVGPDGAIYVGNYDSPRGYLYAITNGVQKWRSQAFPPIFSNPVIATNGTIYFGDDNGRIYALNPSNGAIIWDRPTGNGSYAITTSPALGTNGTIYVGVGAMANPRFYSLTPSGATNWIFICGSSVSSSPAIGVDGTIYFGCNDSKLYALHPNGTKKWDLLLGGKVRSSPAIASDGTIYVGSDDGALHAVSPAGMNLWSVPTSNKVFSSPAIGNDGTIYFGSEDGRLFAVSGTSRLAATAWPMFHKNPRHTGKTFAPGTVTPSFTGGGPMRLLLAGAAGQSYQVEATTNLTDWRFVTNIISFSATTNLVDPASTGLSHRVYRVWSP